MPKLCLMTTRKKICRSLCLALFAFSEASCFAVLLRVNVRNAYAHSIAPDASCSIKACRTVNKVAFSNMLNRLKPLYRPSFEQIPGKAEPFKSRRLAQ